MRRWDCMVTMVIEDDSTHRLFPTYDLGAEHVVARDGEDVSTEELFDMISKYGMEVDISGPVRA